MNDKKVNVTAGQEKVFSSGTNHLSGKLKKLLAPRLTIEMVDGGDGSGMVAWWWR